MKKRIHLAILLFLFIIINLTTTNVLSIENSGTVAGSFTASNTAPSAFTNISIQDGSSTWDNTALDTHDITPNILWKNNTDANGEAVTSHVCIANATTYITQFIAGKSGNCSYSATIAAGTYTVSSISGLKFNGTNTTYYITLIPDDGIDNGTELNGTFRFLDNLPVLSQLNITQTHDQSPHISWKVTDADTGGQDKWPAGSPSSFIHYLWVGNNTS